MTNHELAYAEIQKLIANFKDMPAAQRKGMNEMQTRLGFILPMFKALGWDTSNINEVSPEEDLDRARILDRRINEVDSEIDRKVYQLYGLTEEEIKIVEEGL